MSHKEQHRSHRTGWLRAAVLGANDGIVSTSSLIIGVAAAGVAQEGVLLAGIAGLVAGAMSMAAGEYVSVSSQSDTEKADLLVEKRSIEDNYHLEKLELAKIYEGRGLDENLALQVADKLMAHDALGAHARDEIGLVVSTAANPLQAALYSAGTFTIGALLPLVGAWIVPESLLVPTVSALSILFLAVLGGLAASAGGASIAIGAMRVTFWGVLAMLLTAGVGWFFGT